MDKLTALETELQMVRKMHSTLIAAKQELRSARIQRFAKELDMLLDERHDAAIRVASDNVAKAKAACDAYAEEHPDMRDKPPVGTRLIKWLPGYFVGDPSIKDKTGVVQVYKRGDAVPGSWSDWRRPNPGAVIVRFLKQDGEESKLIGTDFHNWHPEGVDPNRRKGKP